MKGQAHSARLRPFGHERTGFNNRTSRTIVTIVSTAGKDSEG
jgi:hypothetical protein